MTPSSRVNLAEPHIYKMEMLTVVDLSVSCPISFFLGLQAIYLWHSLTTVGLFISIHEGNNLNYMPAGRQMDEQSPMSPQSANGPSTYDEALKYFELSLDNQFNIAGNPAYGPSLDAQGVPVHAPHLYHLSLQGGSTQPIYHNHSQHPPPTRPMTATHHQGTWYSCAFRG